MLTVPQALDLAVQHHQAGQLPQAEQLYRAILQVDPCQVDALHLLGVIAYQVGQHDRASAYLGQALRLQPDYAEAHWNRALTWLLAGNFEQGWPEYEWRWQRKEFALPRFPQPLW